LSDQRRASLGTASSPLSSSATWSSAESSSWGDLAAESIGRALWQHIEVGGRTIAVVGTPLIPSLIHLSTKDPKRSRELVARQGRGARRDVLREHRTRTGGAGLVFPSAAGTPPGPTMPLTSPDASRLRRRSRCC